MKLFDSTIHSLEKSLDYAMLKNKTISNNIANVDTPGYKTKEVDFKKVFNQALSESVEANRTHEKHIPFQVVSHNLPIKTGKNTTYTNNGNNVDIDLEMTELAKNQIYYQSLVDRLNGKFNSILTVLKGGS